MKYEENEFSYNFNNNDSYFLVLIMFPLVPTIYAVNKAKLE